VEADRALVVADDAGEDGVEAVGSGDRQQLGEQRAADAAALVVAVDVHGVLDTGGVRRLGPPR
jgi:hypothetical protein